MHGEVHDTPCGMTGRQTPSQEEIRNREVAYKTNTLLVM